MGLPDEKSRRAEVEVFNKMLRIYEFHRLIRKRQRPTGVQIDRGGAWPKIAVDPPRQGVGAAAYVNANTAAVALQVVGDLPAGPPAVRVESNRVLGSQQELKKF